MKRLVRQTASMPRDTIPRANFAKRGPRSSHRVTYRRLPSLEGRRPSDALTDTGQTRLGRSIAPLAAAHPARSGIHALRDVREAFAARILLAQVTQRSHDVQYYIWHKDPTGTLLFEAMLAAAERGVRVGMLLDDNNTVGLDPTLGALDSMTDLIFVSPVSKTGLHGRHHSEPKSSVREIADPRRSP